MAALFTALMLLAGCDAPGKDEGRYHAVYAVAATFPERERDEIVIRNGWSAQYCENPDGVWLLMADGEEPFLFTGPCWLVRGPQAKDYPAYCVTTGWTVAGILAEEC